MNDDLLPFMPRSITRDRSVFLKPNIPEKKLRNAIDEYCRRVTRDEVVVLIDDTVFGAADEGLVVTNDYIYIRHMLSDIQKYKIKNLNSISCVKNTMNVTIYIDSKDYTGEIEAARLTQVKYEYVKDFCSGLNSYVRNLHKNSESDNEKWIF